MKKALLFLACTLMMAASMSLKAQEVTFLLRPGWNWIGYPYPESVDLENAFGDFEPMTDDVIESFWGYSEYVTGYGWFGGIDELKPGWGYMYYSNRTEAVSIVFSHPSTPVGSVTVTTSEPMLITAISAMGGGEVTTNDGTYIIVKGLCWATHENPTTNDDFFQEAESGVGSFSISMTGLNIATTYYVRAYAVTPNGTVYGDQKSFTTRDGIPTLTTAEATDIQGETATCGGNITDNGGLSVIACGVCWSTSPNLADLHILESYDFENGLLPTNWINDVTYPWIVSQNTSSGNYFIKSGNSGVHNSNSSIQIMVEFDDAGAVSFDALCQGEGTTTIWDKCIFSIDGEVQFNNGAEVSDWNHYSFFVTAGMHTFEWSYIKDVSVNPTGDAFSIDNVAFSNLAFSEISGSMDSFSSNITCLNLSTTYYVRAYANTAAGTGYGEQVSFTTRNGIPTVTTDGATNIGKGWAYVVGNIPDDGGLSVTARGMCWSTSHIPTLDDSHTVNGTGTGSFGGRLTDLTPGTTYYVRAYASNSYVTIYGSEMSFTTLEGGGGSGTAPMGAIDGKFTITAGGDQVYFSQGNLQYIGSAATPYWKFADNQWDVLGTTTGQNSYAQNVDRDLFCWGTSGYNHGANCYQPWSTGGSYSDYYAYGNYQYNLYDQTGQADWGYNPISNGGNQANQWRTLTTDEWAYVFNTRTTSSGIRFAKAKVNDVNGVILLPDDWSSDTYSLSDTNSSGASFSSNTISASQWNTLEQAGAVFLPAAGHCYGASVSFVGSRGYYWSASCYNSGRAGLVYFYDSGLFTDSYTDRSLGQSVRLVAPAEN